MAAKYSGTILPQSNDVTEIQKAILDLLRKINEVSGGDSSTVASFSAAGTSKISIPDSISTFTLIGELTTNVALQLAKPSSGLRSYSILLRAYSQTGKKFILSGGSSVTANLVPPTAASYLFVSVYVDEDGNVYIPVSRYA